MPNMPNHKDACILVVDDQPPNVKLLERILTSSGFTNVLSTTDSREVSTLYREHQVDLILLDINMPHKSGFDVMEELNEIESESYLPILVLTAQTDDETRFKALDLGAKDFLTKPFERIEVLTRIRNMLEVRLLHNQVREQNKTLEEKVRIRTEELVDTRMEIIRRLGRAAEYRDNETGFHIIRMSHFCEIIALECGMNPFEADLLLNASPMHDIGKIGIPDSILLKPGKLDKNEWEIMKTHTTIGAEILSGHPSKLMETARIIALTHHEKWDGSGYPNNLKGEDIPLVGRIVAVSDVFDALTSERPYKKAWSVEDALKEIQSGAGKHFDPDIVTVMMDSLPKILEIKQQYQEPEAAGEHMFTVQTAHIAGN